MTRSPPISQVCWQKPPNFNSVEAIAVHQHPRYCEELSRHEPARDGRDSPRIAHWIWMHNFDLLVFRATIFFLIDTD